MLYIKKDLRSGEFYSDEYYIATVDERGNWSKVEKYIQKKGKSNSNFYYEKSHIRLKMRTAKAVLSVLNGKLNETIINSQVLNRKKYEEKIFFSKRRLEF